MENTVYSDIHEMADVFKESYGTYLPDTFDYIAHLCHFRGVLAI